MSRFTEFTKKTANIVKPIAMFSSSVGTAAIVRSVLQTVPAANPVAAGINLIGAVALSGFASSRVADYVDDSFKDFSTAVDAFEKELKEKKTDKSTDKKSDI